MKKLLLFSTLYPNIEQPLHGIFVEKRLLELRKRADFDVVIVAPVPWMPKWLGWKNNNVNYASIPESEIRAGLKVLHPRYIVIPKFSWPFAPIMLFLGSFFAVRALVKTQEIDLIDAHFVFPDGIAAVMHGKLIGVPVLMTARGSDLNESPKYRLPRWFIRWGLQRAHSLIAVSSRLAEQAKHLARSPISVLVSPNGVDTEMFKPSAHCNKPRLSEGKNILMVASLRTLKGHEFIIRALAEDSLEEYELSIIGGGELDGYLKQLVIDLNLQSRVSFLGNIPNAELAPYYSRADVFVLASSNEGCPNVVLEALACGTPVVATNVGAIPDLIPESMHSYMVSERTPERFAEAIVACEKHQFSEEELTTHAQSLNWESTCQSLLPIMEAAASRRPLSSNLE